VTTKHTLPSGLVVEMGDHYGWLGDDVQGIWDSITDDGHQVRDMRFACIRALAASTSDPAALPVPPEPEHIRALPAADYVAVMNLPPVRAAVDLVLGRSVAPVPDADPTRPTPDTSGSSPD